MRRSSFLWLAAVAVIFIFAAALSIPSQTVNMGRTYISSQNVRYPNEAGTGTTVNKLAKLTGAPSTAIIAATTDTEGIIGIVVAGAGTTGNADIAFSGKALCDFDSATTAGHYVTIDTSTAGDCMDTGAVTYPTSGQVIGVVTSTNGGAGTYEVDLTIGQAQAGGAGGGGGESVIAYASLPGTCTDGTAYSFTDSLFRAVCDPTNTFNYFYGTKQMTPPPTTGWSWDNQDSAVETIVGGAINLYRAASAVASVRARYRTAPSTPYQITLFILFNVQPANFSAAGALWRESGSGKIVDFQRRYSAGTHEYALAKRTNATTFSAWYNENLIAPDLIPRGYVQGMRLVDNGTNRLLYVTWNMGVTWTLLHTVGNTDFLTADQVGFFVNPENASRDVSMTLLSWEEGTP